MTSTRWRDVVVLLALGAGAWSLGACKGKDKDAGNVAAGSGSAAGAGSAAGSGSAAAAGSAAGAGSGSDSGSAAGSGSGAGSAAGAGSGSGSDSGAGAGSAAAAPSGPVRTPTIDCLTQLPPKLYAKLVPGAKVSAVEGGCRIDDRAGKPFAVSYFRCAPEGTTISKEKGWDWEALAKTAPAIELPYRITATFPFKDVACVSVTHGIEKVSVDKIQDVGRVGRDELLPWMAKTYPTTLTP